MESIAPHVVATPNNSVARRIVSSARRWLRGLKRAFKSDPNEVQEAIEHSSCAVAWTGAIAKMWKRARSTVTRNQSATAGCFLALQLALLRMIVWVLLGFSGPGHRSHAVMHMQFDETKHTLSHRTPALWSKLRSKKREQNRCPMRDMYWCIRK